MDQKTVTISKWAKPSATGQAMKQVVIHTLIGKNRKGKQIYKSQTRHIPI